MRLQKFTVNKIRHDQNAVLYVYTAQNAYGHLVRQENVLHKMLKHINQIEIWQGSLEQTKIGRGMSSDPPEYKVEENRSNYPNIWPPIRHWNRFLQGW